MEEVNLPQRLTNDDNVLDTMPGNQITYVYNAAGLSQESVPHQGLPQESYSYPGYSANPPTVGQPQQGLPLEGYVGHSANPPTVGLSEKDLPGNGPP